MPVGKSDIAGVDLKRALGLEAEAGLLVLEVRRAFPRRSGLDHRRFQGLDLPLERLDLLLEELKLCVGIADRSSPRDGRVGGGVGRVGLSILGEGAGCRQQGAAAKQPAHHSRTDHCHFPLSPSRIPPGSMVRIGYLRTEKSSGWSVRARFCARARIPAGAAISPYCSR